MILYLVIILLANLGIAAGISLATSSSFFLALGMTALATVIVILVNALTATLCRMLPEKCADRDLKFFQVSPKEKKFYEKLKIRKWKDKIPEIGQFTGFRKNKIVDPKSAEYLERFLLEICYGQLCHLVSCFTSFLILLLFPLYRYWLAASIAVSLVSVALNLLPTFTLRYNSYKLRVLHKSVLKKEQREEKREATVA